VNAHPQFDEDFDLHALGALDQQEEQALELHLSGCPDCRLKLEEARGRMAALALAAPSEVPPQMARKRLLDQIRSELGKQPAPSALLRWLVPVLAATSAALAIALWRQASQNRELAQSVQVLQAEIQRQGTETARARAVLEVLTAPDTLKVTLVAGTAHPVPQGKAFYHSRKGLVFYAANLPALPPNRTYQLWLVPAQGNPISAGIFQVDAQGNGAVLLPPLPTNVAAKAFAVTVEPAGGVPQPTGPKVLIGLVS